MNDINNASSKHHRPIKFVAGIIGVLVAILTILTIVFFTNPGFQMKIMSHYVMKNLSNYHWSALQMEDPVTPVLSESFGSENTESITGLYGYLKDAAKEMKWKIIETNPEELTSTVEVQYIDSAAFLSQYGNSLGDFIITAIDEDRMQMSDISNVLEFISDEENSALIHAARETSKGKEVSYKTTTVTINFQNNGKLFIPTGTSDEIFDAASAGLTSGLDDMTQIIAVHIIPRIVDRVFHAVKVFDEPKLESFTGSPLNKLIGLSENNKMYLVLHDYMKECASKMDYTVGEFNEETSSVEIDCTFLDSKNVIEEYLKCAALYYAQQLFLGNSSAKDSSNLMKQATENADENRITKTVTITFDSNDYSKFTVSEEMYDVVSANLYSTFTQVPRNLGGSKK